MNYVSIIGQIEGDAEVAFTSKNGENKLYKFKVKVPKSYKTKDGTKAEDTINIKVWSNAIEDEYTLHDQAVVGIEGRIQSFGVNNGGNEVIANRVLYIN